VAASAGCNATAGRGRDGIGIHFRPEEVNDMTITTESTSPTPAPTAAPSAAELDQFIGRFVTDLGAVAHAASVVLGDKLGLYRALAELGPSTPSELAARTGCDARYVTEWLCAQAASGYAQYDPGTGRFHLDAAQTVCLADETHPAFLAGGMAVVSAMHKDEHKVTARFTTGEGLGWHEHHDDLFVGTERFFRPSYVANLASSWIPALDGVESKLQAGARVADVGCGHGASTILLALSYPEIEVTGSDYHAPSIEIARRRAAEAGVGDRVRFEVAGADEFGEGQYDLICIFDALHDMGDPAAAARHIRSRLTPDGTWLLVEPRAGDRVEDNLNVVGRIFYSASTFICTPASRAQDGAACLGAQAGPAVLRGITEQAGFTRFREAVDSPFNLVLEVRP
jgi:2-polyprenyl-3-methyl-5-hydroxy-6-metoxy-1,4-benzoquinol methylase